MALTGLTGLIGLTACAGNNADTGQALRTVTVTTSPAPSTATSSPTATSDVRGRSYDLGTVKSTSTVGGVRLVELDRWTLPGTTDSTLAARGVAVVPHRGARYTNQNPRKTYTAPIADGASIVVNTCVARPDGQLGLSARPLHAADWLERFDPRAVLVVTYNARGQITRLDTDPRC